MIAGDGVPGTGGTQHRVRHPPGGFLPGPPAGSVRRPPLLAGSIRPPAHEAEEDGLVRIVTIRIQRRIRTASIPSGGPSGRRRRRTPPRFLPAPIASGTQETPLPQSLISPPPSHRKPGSPEAFQEDEHFKFNFLSDINCCTF